MGMKKYFVFALGMSALISISCELGVFSIGKDAEQELTKPPAAGPPLGGELLGQEPAPDKMIEGDEDDKKNADQPPTPVPPAPSEPTAEAPTSDDFTMVDENGVIITKKNGMQITKMPSGEVYYLPDEF